MIDGLEKIINEIDDVEIVGIACNGKEAVDKVPIIRPDLVLMDLDMPILNGLEASRILLKEVSNLKIVILTMHGERSIVERMMKLGIYGYLIKNADKEELKIGIARVLKGKKYFQVSTFPRIITTLQ